LPRQIKDIIRIMEKLAPPERAESWDNVGLLVGSSTAPVRRIMVTLDVTAEGIRDAERKQTDLIISHHPVLFRPVSAINDSTAEGSLLLQLLYSGIAVYSAHTNFDKAAGGTDDTLAELLGLQDVCPLTGSGNGFDPDRPGFGRIGKLSERQSLEHYLGKVRSALGAGKADYIGNPEKEIHTVASCAGAGGDFIQQARQAGADLFITGEVKYHEALPTLDGDMALATFGHYATERPAMNRLIQHLQNSINALQYNVEVIPSSDYGIYFRRLRE